MNSKTKLIIRWVVYLFGMIILAFGITANTKAGLGVSPIISVAYSVSEIWGLSFPNMTLVWYSIFIVTEILIHIGMKKDKKILVMDTLQFPISLIVTRFIGLFQIIIPDFAVDYAGSFWGSIPGRLIVLAGAIVLTGLGAAMSLDTRIVPNPGDGIVQALADVFKKEVGNMKNIFDFICVGVTSAISFLFVHHIIGIGIGTLLAMIFVGRVVALFNHFFLERIESLR